MAQSGGRCTLQQVVGTGRCQGVTEGRARPLRSFRGCDRKTFSGTSSFDLHSGPGRWGRCYARRTDDAAELPSDAPQAAPCVPSPRSPAPARGCIRGFP